MSHKESLWTGNLLIDQTDLKTLRYSFIKKNLKLFFLFFVRQCCGIKVNMMFLEDSKSKQSTFNWSSGIKLIFITFNFFGFLLLEMTQVQVFKYPYAVLKTKERNGLKINLKKYIKVRSDTNLYYINNENLLFRIPNLFAYQVEEKKGNIPSLVILCNI